MFLLHQDLEYVLHTASPFKQTWADAVQDMLDPAIQGTLQTLRSIKAHAAHVKRVVVLSSIVTLMEPTESKHIDESLWNPVTRDAAISNPRLTYVGSKVWLPMSKFDFH